VTITTDLFNAYLHCPSKSWLRSLRGPSGANPYAEWTQSNAQFYRSEGLKRLLPENPSVECSAAPTEPMSWKAEKWLLAVEVTVRAFSPSESYTLESFIDAIERVSSPGRGKAAQFIPVRFIPANKPTKNDRLLLAFDAWVLSRALRREVKCGTVIHGDPHIAQRVKTIPLTSELQKLLGELAAPVEPSKQALLRASPKRTQVRLKPLLLFSVWLAPDVLQPTGDLWRKSSVCGLNGFLPTLRVGSLHLNPQPRSALLLLRPLSAGRFASLRFRQKNMAHHIFQLESELQNFPEAAPSSLSFSVSEKLAR
jgi:hypothetical protein